MSYKNNNERLNNIVCIVVSFILSLTLTCSLLFLTLNNTFFNENFLNNHIKKSDYVSLKISELENVYVSLGLASNFEEEFMISIIDKEQFQADVKEIVNATYSGIDFKLDEATLKQNYYDKFLKNAEERGFKITEENKQAIDYLASECVKAYKTEVTFLNNDFLKSYLHKFNSFISTALIFVGVLSLICLLFIVLLNRRKYNILKYLNYSIITSFLIIGIPTIIIIASNKIDKIGILNEALYKLITSYINSVVNQMLIMTIILLVVSVLVYILYFISRKKYLRTFRSKSKKV